MIPEFSEYRAPFVGGGSLFVYLKQLYPDKSFWINDIYENLYLFWNECKDNPDLLIQHIREFRSQFSDGKDLHKYLLNNIDSFDNTKKAAVSGGFFI